MKRIRITDPARLLNTGNVGSRRTLRYRLKYWRHLFTVDCTNCRYPVPYGVEKCPRCDEPQTLEALYDATFGLLKRKINYRAKTASDNTLRRFQWGYLAVSAIALWVALPIVQGRIRAQLLSIIFITAITAYAVWLFPTPWARIYFWRTSGLLRLAVTFNLFTLTLLLQCFIDLNWERSLSFAFLFLEAFVAAHLLLGGVVTPAYLIYLLFVKPETPSNVEQGRTINIDIK